MLIARPLVVFFGLMILSGRPLQAEGFMPPPPKTTLDNAPTVQLLIGQEIPMSLTVKDADGLVRTVVSYKESLDILVIGFFSPSCPADQASWAAWSRFYKEYIGWHVAFIGLLENSTDDPAELSKKMTKAGLPFPLFTDGQETIAHVLGMKSLPGIVIMDETFTLRYRGPMGTDARKAIESVIGHVDAVPHPQPVTTTGCAIP